MEFPEVEEFVDDVLASFKSAIGGYPEQLVDAIRCDVKKLYETAFQEKVAAAIKQLKENPEKPTVRIVCDETGAQIKGFGDYVLYRIENIDEFECTNQGWDGSFYLQLERSKEPDELMK